MIAACRPAITAGLPLDARMLGPAVWATPTAGYLLGFAAGAFAAGWVARARCAAGSPARSCSPARRESSPSTPSAQPGSRCSSFTEISPPDLPPASRPFILIDSLKAAAAALLSGAGRSAVRRVDGRPLMISSDQIRAALPLALGETHLPLPERKTGKVREWYTLDDGRKLFVTTDRLSAFDRILARVPFKGQVLNQLSAWWFDITRDLIDNQHGLHPGSERRRRADGQALPGGNRRARLHHRRHHHRAVVPLFPRRTQYLRLRLPRRLEEKPGAARTDPHPDHQGRRGRARRTADLRRGGRARLARSRRRGKRSAPPRSRFSAAGRKWPRGPA